MPKVAALFNVMMRFAAPRFTDVVANVSAPLFTASPKVKSPPMVMLVYLPLRSRAAVAVDRIVPPLMVNVPPAPMAFTPPTATVPALIVKPPVKALPLRLQIPGPFLVKPVPAAVERAWPWKFNVFPLATVTEATVPPVPSVPPAVSVTLSFAVIEANAVVAPMRANAVPPLSTKFASDPETQALVKGPASEEPQKLPVQALAAVVDL